MISPGVFFSFSKFLVFWVARGVKGQKMVQNDKKICLLHLISHFFSSKFWLLGSLRGELVKGQKITQNDKKLCLSHSASQELYIIYCDFWYTCVKWWYPANFLIFQNFDFGGFLGGKMAKNNLNLPISECFALYLRNCRSYQDFFDNDIYRCFSLFFWKDSTW